MADVPPRGTWPTTADLGITFGGPNAWELGLMWDAVHGPTKPFYWIKKIDMYEPNKAKTAEQAN